MKKEKEQQNTNNSKYIEDLKRNHEQLLKEAQEKYARTCAEHDVRITDLTKSHATQCESLCREILKANLEADRLQNELDPTKKRTVMPFSEPNRIDRMGFIGKMVIALLITLVVSSILGKQLLLGWSLLVVKIDVMAHPKNCNLMLFLSISLEGPGVRLGQIRIGEFNLFASDAW